MKKLLLTATIVGAAIAGIILYIANEERNAIRMKARRKKLKRAPTRKLHF